MVDVVGHNWLSIGVDLVEGNRILLERRALHGSRRYRGLHYREEAAQREPSRRAVCRGEQIVPRVALRAGREYLVMPPDRRAELHRLAARLRSAGIDVDLEIMEYAPNQYGIGILEPEAIAFYIAGAVSTALCSPTSRMTSTSTRRSGQSGDSVRRRRDTLRGGTDQRPSRSTAPAERFLSAGRLTMTATAKGRCLSRDFATTPT